MADRLDVDAMLDELTPEQFDEWIAYRKIEPDETERLMEILKRGFAAVCNAWGGKCDPDDFDPCDDEQKQTAGEQEVSPEQGAAMFAATFGSGRRG